MVSSDERGAVELDRRTVLQSVGAGALALGAGVGGVGANRHGVLEEPLVRGSTEQVLVMGAEAGEELALRSEGTTVTTATADELGAHAFRDVEPGVGYTVIERSDGEQRTLAADVEVLSREFEPPQALYDDQQLESGFNYIETRDGTTLAAQVALPDASEFGEGPYPVVIDYSGYEPSTNFWDGIDDRFNGLGYAVVGVNMRGTACSGGKFDFVERLHWLDGYDAVETIATQEWADGVALAGKSYPGYTQLYVAATRPPSLDAIVPGHVVGGFYRDVAYPGGLQNVTYAQRWAGERDAEAQPGGSMGNVDQRIEDGDETCERNQLLRGQNRNLVDTIESTPFYDGVFEARTAWTLVEEIDVPTLLVGAWQDEQTGSRPIRLLEQFDDDPPVRLVASNGDHGEYYGPEVFPEIERFLAYYLEESVPESDDEEFDEYASALAAYEREDPVTVYWELDDDRMARGRSSYAEWPPGETWELYLQPDGRLDTEPPGDEGPEASSYEYDPESFLLQLPSRDGPRIEWERPDDSEFVGFVSEELTEDRVCVGSGLVELWLRSSADDTDLQVTLSELRPDGQEMLVQTGWLRASHRVEDEQRSLPRRPWHTHREADTEMLPDGEFANLRVELFPFGHVFREGSRVALSVEPVGGTRGEWGFDVVDQTATNEVAHTPEMASTLELPLVEEPAPTDGLPPCDDVREQPCRDASPETFLRATETTVSVSVTGEGGDPVSNATVELLAGETVLATTTTDSSGTGEVGGSADAALELRVSAEGFESTQTVVGDSGSLDVTLEPVDDGGDEDGATDDGAGDDTSDGEDSGGGQAGGDDAAGEDGDDEDGSGPGFTLPAGVASVGGAAYLLKRRLAGDGSDTDAE